MFKRINDEYSYGKYNDLKVIVMNRNGYINVSNLCALGDKNLKHWRKTKDSEELIKITSRLSRINKKNITITVKNENKNNISGIYMHPFVATHIAMWISPKFSVYVKHIVDSFSVKDAREKMDEELQNKDAELQKKDEELERLDDQIYELTNLAEEIQVDTNN